MEIGIYNMASYTIYGGNMKKVDKNSPIPIYYQIKEIIKEMIDNGELKPKDLIVSERELCQYHGVSRMTVNKAITGLVTEGYLYREQGSGTYVADPKMNYRISGLSGLTEEMVIRRGLKVNTEIISFEEKSPSRSIRVSLELEEGENVYKIIRLRKVEMVAYALEVSYIPVTLCPDFNVSKLENKSLYSVLRTEYGLDMEYANQTIEPIMIDEYEGTLLGIKENSLALLFIRQTCTSSGKPFEVTRSTYRTDKYKFEIILKK